MTDIAQVRLTAIDGITAVLRRISGATDDLRGRWGGLIGVLGAGGSVAYLTSLVKQSIDAADRLNELQSITGVSVQTLSALQLAAANSGIDIEALASGINKMQRAMIEARDGNVALAATFRALGVDINGGTKEALYAVATAFESMPDGAQKTALAMQLFGRSGASLIPFLNQGAAGLAEMEELAAKLGLTITEETAASADRFADVLGIMGQQTKGLGNELMRQLLPTLEGLSKLWLDNAGAGGLMSSAVTVLVNVLKGFLITIVGAIGYAKAFGESVMAIFSAMSAASRAGGLISANGRAAFAEALSAGFDQAGASARATTQRIQEITLNTMPSLETSTVKAAKALGDLGKQTRDAEAAQKAAQKAAEEFARAKGQLTEKASEYIQTQALELAGGEKLSDAQKQMLAIGEMLRDNYTRLTAAEREQYTQLLLTIGANADAIERRKSLSKTLDEYAKTSEKAVEAQQRETDSLLQKATAIQDEIDKLGLTKSEQDAVTARRLANEAAALRELSAIMQLAGEGYGAEYEALQRRISAIDLVLDRQQTLQAKNAMVEAAEASTKAWTETARDIEQALTNAMVNGWGQGKSVLKQVGDWIINYFKTTIARSIAQSLTSALSSVLGRAGSAGVGILGSLFSGGAAAAGGAGAGAGGILTSLLGSLFGGSSILSFAGTGLMSTLTGVGLGTSMGAAGALLGGGNLLGGLGMGLGAAAPYLAAVTGLYALITGLGTGRQRSPARQNLGFVDSRGQSIGMGAFAPFMRNGGISDQYLSLAGGVAGTVAGTARALGGSAADLHYALYSSHSPDGLGAQVVGGVYGSPGTGHAAGTAGRYMHRDVQTSNADMQRTLQAMVPAMILTGLQQSDLPVRISEYLRSIDASTASDEQINAAIQTALAVKSMTDAVAGAGGVFGRLADLSVDARVELANLTGGMDQFVQKVSGFVGNFYSEDEQRAIQAQQIVTALQTAGVDVRGLNSRAAFRGLVEASDVNTQAGRAQLAALLNVQGQFASLADYLASSGTSLQSLAAQAPQINAINGVAQATSDGSARVVTSITDLDDTVTSIGEQISNAVREEVQALREASLDAYAAIAANTRDTADTLERWTRAGLPATAT